MVKNWTQGTDWVKINSFPANNPTDNRYTDTIYLYMEPAVVQDGYVCMVPTYDLSGASLADGSQWKAVNNKTIIIFPVLDLTTNTVSIAKMENSPRYGSFPDPDWYWRGIDHTNQKIFAHAYDDGITNNVGIFRTYKFDPVAMSISVHATLAYGLDVNYVYNHNKSYYLIQTSATDVDFYDANTSGARATNFNPGTYLYYPMDWVMDDNNNRAWVFKNTGDIVGVTRRPAPSYPLLQVSLQAQAVHIFGLLE